MPIRNLTAEAALMAAASLLITSCGENQAANEPAHAYISDIDVLDSRLNRLSQDIESVREIVNEIDREPTLKLSDGGWSNVRTDFGAATIEWKNSSARGTGSRVELRVGNTTNATWLKYTIVALATKNSAETKVVTQVINQKISAGSWSNINLDVEGFPPNELESIKILYFGISNLSLLDS